MQAAAASNAFPCDCSGQIQTERREKSLWTEWDTHADATTGCCSTPLVRAHKQNSAKATCLGRKLCLHNPDAGTGKADSTTRPRKYKGELCCCGRLLTAVRAGVHYYYLSVLSFSLLTPFPYYRSYYSKLLESNMLEIEQYSNPQTTCNHYRLYPKQIK